MSEQQIPEAEPVRFYGEGEAGHVQDNGWFCGAASLPMAAPDQLLHIGQEIGVYEAPRFSGWQCHLFGGTGASSPITWRPPEGRVPNAFWRFMQWACFGHRWEKVK